MAAALAAAACGAPPAGPQGYPPTGVQIAEVQQRAILDATEYVATLKSRRSVLIQPQVDGQVAQILVKSGDVVKRGALLLQIDPARQVHTVASTKASAVSKEAALNYARDEFKRVEALFKGGAASQQELDQAKSGLATSEADLAALGAQVREGEVQLRYFSVSAPEDGVVGDVPVREGDYVTPQTQLTTIDQNEALELYVSVPVERQRELKLNQLVQLIDNDGQVLADSFVTFISPQVDQATQSILVKTAVQNLRHDLRTGQFVRARVVWRKIEGPVLPTTAIKRLSGQTFAFAAMEKDGKQVAQQRPVALGPVDGNDYPVLKGFAVGEKVIVSGLQKLGDGAPIQPLPPAAAAGNDDGGGAPAAAK